LQCILLILKTVISIKNKSTFSIEQVLVKT
jgi:hypothetical protein